MPEAGYVWSLLAWASTGKVYDLNIIPLFLLRIEQIL